MGILYFGLLIISWQIASAIYCPKSGYQLGPSLYCFKTVQDKKSFDDANERCRLDGGLLTKMDDDFDFVRKLIREARPKAKGGDSLNGYWIGARRDSSDRFRWLDGTRVDPISGKNSHWYPGEPNDYWFRTESEDCVESYESHKAWNDVPCSIKMRYICQIDSVDPCDSPSPICGNGGKCSSQDREVVCSCPPGFEGDRCQKDVRPCTLNPCLNGAQCRNIIKNTKSSKNTFSFECLCPQEYEGKRCEKKIDPCEKIDCANGGTCVPMGVRRWSCTCPSGYSGIWCETSLSPCELKPCQNSGFCENVDNSFVCSCQPGFQGDKCEVEDACRKAGHPCLNKGKCQMKAGGFEKGTDGYEYKYHNESKTWQAAKTTCETEGANLVMIKSKETHDYLKTKYTASRLWIGLLRKEGEFEFVDGSKLGVSITYWASGEPNNLSGNEDCILINYRAPGMWNDGTCTKKFGFICQKDHSAVPECACSKGYRGTGCEHGPCYSSPCQNGGTCNEKDGDYFCECDPKFSGRNCTKECPFAVKDGFPDKLDILFLLDGSGSVGKTNYIKSLKFVDAVIDKVNLGKGHGRVAYVQFAGWYSSRRNYWYEQIKVESEIRFPTSEKMSKKTLRRKIASDTIKKGGTRTGDALKYVLDRFQTDARMSDQNVAKYLMVLTDGRSSGQSNMIKKISDHIFKENITAFAIGVGKKISTKELDYITHGDKYHQFTVNDFAKLDETFIKTIIDKQCYVGPCESSPCLNGAKCIEYDNVYSCECRPTGKYAGTHCENKCRDVIVGGLPEKLDALFLVDGSGSIDETEGFEKAKELIKRVLMKMTIAEDKGRVAIVQFAGRRDDEGEWRSTETKDEITFKNSTQMGKLKVIDSLDHEAKWNGWTLTGEAMMQAAELFENEARPNAAKYLFVITDGRVTRDLDKVKAAAKTLASNDVVNVAIGVGKDVDQNVLALIANGDSNRIFTGESFVAVGNTMINRVVQNRCG